MAKSFVLTLVLVSSLPAMASASSIVMGTSPARSCYEAAESPRRPTINSLQDCDRVIANHALSMDDLVATHVNRGVIRVRRGNVAAGIEDFDSALALNSRQPEAYLNKAIVLMRRPAASEALQLFSRAIEFNTGRPERAYYGRGIANEALGNVAEAYRDYRQASQLDPDWAEPRTALQRFPASR